MGKQKTIWNCLECGHKEFKWVGSCSVCNQWNTFVEEINFEKKQHRFESPRQEGSSPRKISDIDIIHFHRMETKIGEFDRLLGGGIVSGSLTLIGGEPGIGKSTLMLQIAEALAKQGNLVLYICGEESIEQTSLRAQRLQISSDNLYLLSETLFSHIKMQVDRLKPKILIVDSIQILYKQEIPSAPGSISQVREIATEFMYLSKGLGISTFLVGHITKSGEIAGPKVLEHIVDTVLDFEGDRHHGYRLLRSVKNRFGATEEVALFQMSADGLKEVLHPSILFMEERAKEIAGTVVIPTLEGSRSILVEVQALVASSSFATSSRRSTGIDQNRLVLLLAILEKRVGYHLYQYDIFVSVAGGIRIFEPATDLGILLAIASSFSNRAISRETVVLGEVGLNGEVRSVSRIESRLKEAIHMGFRVCFMPKKNKDKLSSEFFDKITIHGIEFVEEAIDMLIR